MASVLFSTVGQAVGGPLGAGIGAAVGASVDRGLFRRSRRGAEDGFATRSAYGEIVPRVFGRTRVGGHLIWATAPLVAGSKAQGRRAQAMSFAMAVSRGPMADIGRIWADGGLLRTSSGDFRTETTFRIHSRGDEPDPLIIAAEGEAHAPSYAHLSYVVFEGFDLGPYGNRIPSMSFEVLADDGAALEWAGQLLALVGAEPEIRSAPPSISGYTAWFDPFTDDVEALLGAAGARTGIRDGRIAVVVEPQVFPVSEADLVVGGSGAEGVAALTQDPRPAGLGLSFQDIERDYQLGWQQEARGGRGSALSVSWPAASTAPAARAIAVRLLQEADAGTEKISLTLPHRFLAVSIGDALELGDGRHWRVVGREIRGLSVQLDGRRIADPLQRTQLPTDPGRIQEAPTFLVPASAAVAVEPPVPIYTAGDGGSILIAVSGGEGWRGADVRLLSGGDEVLIGSVSERLPFGLLAHAVSEGPDTIWDERSILLVDMSSGSEGFLTRERCDVLDGGGLLSVGSELIQYREASISSGSLVRLSGLLRGRFGTLPVGAPAGALVMMLPRGGGAQAQAGRDSVGRDMAFLVDGYGDPMGGSLLTYRVCGSGWAPLSPVHLRSERRYDGTLVCSWAERDRNAWRWDAPEIISGQRYLCHFRVGAGATYTMAAVGSDVRLDPIDQIAAFGALFAEGQFRVEAVGDGPAELRVTPWVAI